MEWAEERVDEVSALNIIFSQATLYEYLNGSRGRALTRTKPPKGSALTRSHEEKNLKQHRFTWQRIILRIGGVVFCLFTNMMMVVASGVSSQHYIIHNHDGRISRRRFFCSGKFLMEETLLRTQTLPTPCFNWVSDKLIKKQTFKVEIWQNRSSHVVFCSEGPITVINNEPGFNLIKSVRVLIKPCLNLFSQRAVYYDS